MSSRTVMPVMAGIVLTISLVSIRYGSIMCLMLFLASGFFLIREKPKLPNIWAYIPFLIYIALNLVFFFLSDDQALAIKRLEKQLVLLFMPSVIFLFVRSGEDIQKSLLAFIGSLFVLSVISLIILMEFYFTNLEFVGSMDENYLQWKYPHLLGIHPTYWSYYLVVASTLLLWLPFSRLQNYARVGLLLIFNLNLFYLANRASIAINIVLIGIWLVFYLRQKSGRSLLKRTAAILGVISLVIVLFLQSSYFRKKIIDLINAKDERFFLWDRSLDIIAQNDFIYGEGIGGGQQRLREIMMEEYGQNDPREEYKEFDVHNQYIHDYLDYGIFGLFSILLIVFYPARYMKRIDKQTLVLASIMLLFFSSQLVESVFIRFQGKVLYATLYPLLIVSIKMAEDLSKNDH
ncbi:O-antigen ligase family protein [Lentiprolixibacter aurantiacus]|uniref:O-antigen ligase family protein n=1 Tax=Lentiprolixibacter aurantiacus TaxID=2993939 RepID=A0AAE3MJF7_9FLAO|nr:O-antigen ligase family protein [Lentiprolixibacter aurantiacus]MCX2718549.1 O-antigen ligase family protein [Lentiprolixibacter aurantiacus]